MYKIIRQINKFDDVEVIELKTLTSTREEATEAQIKDYYFLEITHEYTNISGIKQSDVEFLYTDNLIWECGDDFDMIATIANKLEDTIETKKQREKIELEKAMYKKCCEVVATLVKAHKEGKIDKIYNFQQGLNKLNDLTLEKWFNPLCKDLVSLLQYEHCEIFKGDEDFYNATSDIAKKMFYGEEK
ncbi:hypothetical protein UT300009_30560 [Paraclostridium bifermentans]